MKEGNRMHMLERHAEAKACYRRAIGADPTHIESHNNLGALLGSDGRYAEAAASLKRATDLLAGTEPKVHNIAAYTNQAGALAALGRRREAVASLDTALDWLESVNPEDDTAWEMVANCYKRLDEPEKAAACNAGGGRGGPDAAKARTGPAPQRPVWEQKGRGGPDAAKARTGPAPQRPVWEQKGRGGPDVPDLGEPAMLEMVADHYDIFEESEKAAVWDALRNDEHIVNPRRMEDVKNAAVFGAKGNGPAMDHYVKGVLMVIAGKKKKALSNFKRAASLDPSLAESHVYAGVILREEGKREEAMACFRKAIEVNPNFAPPYAEIAITLNMAGKNAEATEYADRALGIDPRLSPVIFLKGTILMNSGMWEDAIECMDRALEITPDDPVLHSCRGMAFFGTGNSREALRCVERALKIDPDFEDAVYTRRMIEQYGLDD